MNHPRWFANATSPSFFGAILDSYDESNSYWFDLNAHWVQPLISAVLFSGVVLGLYLIGRFMSPPAQPFTHRRNSYDPAQQ
jgi:hypothetical protein